MALYLAKHHTKLDKRAPSSGFKRRVRVITVLPPGCPHAALARRCTDRCPFPALHCPGLPCPGLPCLPALPGPARPCLTVLRPAASPCNAHPASTPSCPAAPRALAPNDAETTTPIRSLSEAQTPPKARQTTSAIRTCSTAHHRAESLPKPPCLAACPQPDPCPVLLSLSLRRPARGSTRLTGSILTRTSNPHQQNPRTLPTHNRAARRRGTRKTGLPFTHARNNPQPPHCRRRVPCSSSLIFAPFRWTRQDRTLPQSTGAGWGNPSPP